MLRAGSFGQAQGRLLWTSSGQALSAKRDLKCGQVLQRAHADGSYPHSLHSLARIHLLIFDDWLRDPLSCSQARDLPEILVYRYGRCANMVVTQVRSADWHSRIRGPAISDAVFDRLIHNAYRLKLEGEFLRKVHSPLHENHR